MQAAWMSRGSSAEDIGGNCPSRSTAPYGKDYEAHSILLQEREKACANQEVAWSRGQQLLLGRRKEMGLLLCRFLPLDAWRKQMLGAGSRRKLAWPCPEEQAGSLLCSLVSRAEILPLNSHQSHP